MEHLAPVLACDRTACTTEEDATAGDFLGIACLSAVRSEYQEMFAACPAIAAYASTQDPATREMPAEPTGTARVSERITRYIWPRFAPRLCFSPCTAQHR